MVLYLSIVFIAMILIAVFNIFFHACGQSVLYIILLVLIATVVEIIIDIFFASIMRWVVPKKFVGPDKNRLFPASKKEQRIYEKLGIKRWKDKVLELGAVTGFRKNKLGDTKDVEYVKRFILEANYGVLVHIACIVFGFAIIFFCPKAFWWTVGLPIAIVNMTLNFMSNSILRYNLPKLHTLYKYNLKRQLAKEKIQTEN